MNIGEKLTEQTGVIGEKIEIGSFEHLEAEHVDFTSMRATSWQQWASTRTVEKPDAM